ncbi:MAG: sugar ABC transporter permease [Termitinemataceae bacterium]|nr:MAG: sugar ABC transporter permease [Termitinemataceae bacterium]
MKYITACMSAIIWGSGQFLNKQKCKGVLFFVFQALLAGIELGTGSLAVLCGRFDPALPDAVFRNAGFFTKGLWGLISLGSVTRESSKTKVYDHSVMLLLAGIIATVVLLLFIVIWIWNIRDAYNTRKHFEETGKRISSADYFRNLWSSSFEYIIITPGMLLILFISIVPIFFAIMVAFTNYNMNFIPPRRLVEWTGFETFANLVKIKIWGSTFVHIFIWTAIWAVLATATAYIFGMLQALLIRSKSVKLPKLWRSVFILPWAVPGIVSLMVFRTMLNKEGAINQLLLNAHLITEAIPFLSDPFWAKASLVLVNVWLGFPYFMTLISGVLVTIPQEIYEAAQIDGANSVQQFRVISLPVIIASTSPQIMMSLTFNFNNFNTIYFLTDGGPANANYQMAGSTDILISWIFKLTLDQRMYNYASALSILIFIVIASVSAWNLLRTRAFKED